MTRPRLIAVSTTSLPDPRARPLNHDPHPWIVVSVFVDSEGQSWERYADGPLTPIDGVRRKRKNATRKR
jgi:hypothetical protein